MGNPDENGLNGEVKDFFQMLANEGIHNAAIGFSKLTGANLQVTQPQVKMVPFTEIPDMFGGPEMEAVGIYLKVEGDIPGQIILVLPYPKAIELVALLMEVPPGTIQSLGTLERSALGELGNMTGTFFLNSMANLTGVTVRPSPPAVMVDMVGAMLDVIIATSSGLGSRVLMIQATFADGERKAEADFWVFPDLKTLEYLAKKSNAAI